MKDGLQRGGPARGFLRATPAHAPGLKSFFLEGSRVPGFGGFRVWGLGVGGLGLGAFSRLNLYFGFVKLGWFKGCRLWVPLALVIGGYRFL